MPHGKGHDKYTGNVNDKRIDENSQSVRFNSKILPPYLRRTRTIEELIPWLYLKGISTGDFTEALEGLLGSDVKGYLRLILFARKSAGGMNGPIGRSVRWPRSATFTSGPTAFISISAWGIPAITNSASWY